MAQYEYLRPEASAPQPASATAGAKESLQPSVFDGIPVDKAKVLDLGPRERPDLPDVSVEVQSYNGRLTGHA